MVGDREKLQNAVAIVNEQNAHFRQMHFEIKYWQKDVLFGVGDQMCIRDRISHFFSVGQIIHGIGLGMVQRNY